MKKFILPLTVVVLAAGMQLTTFNSTNTTIKKHAKAKGTIIDIGSFYCSIGLCEAYGPSDSHTVSYVIDSQGNQYTAHGAYIPVGGDQGTISLGFKVSPTVFVDFRGIYSV